MMLQHHYGMHMFGDDLAQGARATMRDHLSGRRQPPRQNLAGTGVHEDDTGEMLMESTVRLPQTSVLLSLHMFVHCLSSLSDCCALPRCQVHDSASSVQMHKLAASTRAP